MPLNLQQHVEKLREAGARAKEAGLQVDLGIFGGNGRPHELRVLLKELPQASDMAARAEDVRTMKTVGLPNIELVSLHQHLQANREAPNRFSLGNFEWRVIYPAQANVENVCNHRMPLTEQEATALRALLEGKKS